MNPASTDFPAPRVTPNLAHAFGGVWRLTWRRFLLPSHWLALAVGLAVLVLLCLGGPHHGQPDRFVAWAVTVYGTMLVPAMAFVAAAGTIRDEMKASAVDYLLTRPVPRPALVLFKFVAHTVCTQIDLLFALGVVVFFAAGDHVPELGLFALKLLFGQALLITAFGAFGFLCGVFTTRYIFLGLAYAAVIEAGVGQIPTQLSRLSMTHQVRDLLGSMLGRSETFTSAPSAIGTTAMLALFCLVMLGVAVAVFTRREFAGPAE